MLFRYTAKMREACEQDLLLQGTHVTCVTHAALPLNPNLPLDRKLGGSFFYVQLELFCLQLSFFAYSPLRPLLDALSHCKQ